MVSPGKASVWDLGLVEKSGAWKVPESETEEMRRWPLGRAVMDPVIGANEARLDDGGLLKFGMPARDMSRVMGAILCRRLSVWRRIKPRLNPRYMSIMVTGDGAHFQHEPALFDFGAQHSNGLFIILDLPPRLAQLLLHTRGLVCHVL